MNKRRPSSSQKKDLRRWLAYRLAVLANQNTRSLAAMYTPEFGLTVTCWRVLAIIGSHGPASSGQVSQYTTLGLDKVSRAADSLVRRQLVARKRHPRDRRIVILSLTAKGRRVNAEISRVRDAIEAELLAVLTAREIDALFAALDKLQAQADRMFTGKHAWREIVARASGKAGDQGAQRHPRPA